MPGARTVAEVGVGVEDAAGKERADVAAAGLHGLTALQQQDADAGLGQRQRREQPCRAAADDDDGVAAGRRRRPCRR
jgi:hypothetical protein